MQITIRMMLESSNHIKIFNREHKRLPAQAHTTIVHNLTCNVDYQLESRMLKCIHICLNHDNKVCRSLLLSKLNCKNSTFASKFHYLSCKYDISHSDFYIDTSHLLGKV